MTHLARSIRLLSVRPESRRRAAATLATAAMLAGLAVAVAPATTAVAATTVAAASHNPMGKLTGKATTATGVTLSGWAFDPDKRTANAYVYALVDGVARASTYTAQPNAAITTAHKTGPTPGFTLGVPVPTGNHTVCVAVGNAGPGVSVLLTCLATPLGRTVSARTKASHSPTGVLSYAHATTSTVNVSGFTTDKDSRNKHLVVVLYVDGQSAASVLTVHTGAGAPKGSGTNASYDITMPVSTGTHQTCVWAVNVGWGHNTFLGCAAVDTRAGRPLAAGSPSVSVLPTVLAQAKKHIGQRYVWGATGPKTFDCSGLMLYSYKKSGFTTPRVSEDQSRAARLIPASHARPGDLVFYHDTYGDVYHVGMYVSPGLTVAAIDTAEGVNYQRIWDPSSTTYGSFTHL